MCATVFYRKLIKGRLDLKVARTCPCTLASEVSRVGGKVVLRLPERDNMFFQE